MPEKTQHWTESLFDSVYALYETAAEYRTAVRAAGVTASTVDFDRRVTHEGQIALVGRTNAWGHTASRAPHAQALSVLHRLYSTVESETQGHYEAAALLYASGAAWAIRAVQRESSRRASSFRSTTTASPVRTPQRSPAWTPMPTARPWMPPTTPFCAAHRPPSTARSSGTGNPSVTTRPERCTAHGPRPPAWPTPPTPTASPPNAP